MKVKVGYYVEEEIEVNDKYKILEGFSKCCLTNDEEDTILESLGYPCSCVMHNNLLDECSETVGSEVCCICTADGNIITER